MAYTFCTPYLCSPTTASDKRMLAILKVHVLDDSVPWSDIARILSTELCKKTLSEAMKSDLHKYNMVHDVYAFEERACKRAWDGMRQDYGAGGLGAGDPIVQEVRGLDFEHDKDVKYVGKKVDHYWKKVEQQREKAEKARKKEEKKVGKPRVIATH